jgi:hypothetical protein
VRWFVTPTLALPLKLLLLGWLIYATIVAAFGVVVRIGAAAKVTMAVLGVFATIVLFPILLGVIVIPVVLYAAPLVAVPRLWRQDRTRAAKIALTVVLVIGSEVAADALGFAAGYTIGWIADRDPCAALHAGVTGSVIPSDECFSKRR